MTSVPKVAICVPYYRQCEGPTLLCAMGLAFRSAAHVAAMPIGTSGCYVEDNRNGCVQYALDTGIPFDWLLWLDSDMIFPDDALLQLISHDKDIVGANYRTRTPPYGYAGHYLDGDDSHLLEPGLWQMGHLPTGVMLTRFEIYQKLDYPWFKPGLNYQPRDDVYFCNLARDNGYKIWCDHDLTFKVRHRAEQEIGWFAPEQIVQVEGAQLNMDKSAEGARDRAKLSRESYEAATRSA